MQKSELSCHVCACDRIPESYQNSSWNTNSNSGYENQSTQQNWNNSENNKDSHWNSNPNSNYDNLDRSRNSRSREQDEDDRWTKDKSGNWAPKGSANRSKSLGPSSSTTTNQPTATLHGADPSAAKAEKKPSEAPKGPPPPPAGRAQFLIPAWKKRGMDAVVFLKEVQLTTPSEPSHPRRTPDSDSTPSNRNPQNRFKHRPKWSSPAQKKRLTQFPPKLRPRSGHIPPPSISKSRRKPNKDARPRYSESTGLKTFQKLQTLWGESLAIARNRHLKFWDWGCRILARFKFSKQNIRPIEGPGFRSGNL